MQRLETLDTVHTHTHTHTHTGILVKINKLEPKINIELFSNVLFLHSQNECKKYILLNSFLC